MATMLSGASVMDAALLLVAGNEPCPQPQTREHVAAMEMLNLEHVLVVQNKVDVVTMEAARQNHTQIKGFIHGTVDHE